MRHDEQVRLIEQLCAHLDAGTNVDAGGLRHNPTATYTDPDQAEREWREWFRGMPQLVGMSGDLPEAGSFLTTDDVGTPILATRDERGAFRAFVETDERGTRRRFTCPFHNWSYDPTGALVGQAAADAHGLDEIIFGRNEPALHHYHDTYRRLLGQEPATLLDRA